MIHMTSAYLCLTDGPRDYFVSCGPLARVVDHCGSSLLTREVRR